MPLTIRATPPAPIGRTPIIGADIEDPLQISFVDRTIRSFRNDFDQVDPVTLAARKIASTAFTCTLTAAEVNQIGAIVTAALVRNGIVPAGTTFAIIDVP